MGFGDAHGVKLGSVPFHAAANCFGHEVLDLLTTDAHVRQPLTSE